MAGYDGNLFCCAAEKCHTAPLGLQSIWPVDVASCCDLCFSSAAFLLCFFVSFFGGLGFPHIYPHLGRGTQYKQNKIQNKYICVYIIFIYIKCKQCRTSRSVLQNTRPPLLPLLPLSICACAHLSFFRIYRQVMHSVCWICAIWGNFWDLSADAMRNDARPSRAELKR